MSDDIGELLHYVQGRLWTRWCCSTEEGNPDLRAAAKRRLGCEKQPVFYVSPGFSEDLLAFLSPEWGISVSFGGFTPATDLTCQVASSSGLPTPDSTVTALECDSAGLPHLEDIELPENIKRLDLSNNWELIDASPLGSLPNLERLDLAGCPELEHLPPRWSGPLESLSLCGCTKLRSLDGLPESLNSLELRTCNNTGTIVLTQCNRIESLAPLARTGLVRTATRIELDGCAGLRTLAGLEALRALKTVLLDPTIAADVSALAMHRSLRIELSLAKFKAFPGSLVRALSFLPRVKLAILTGDDLEDCSGLAAIASLVELDMCECPKIEDLAWVVGLSALKWLRLSAGSPAASQTEGFHFNTKSKIRELQLAICVEKNLPLPPHLDTASRVD
jgi:hypothetical protein